MEDVKGPKVFRRLNKVVKKYGSSNVIIFTREERDIFNFKEGDIIVLDIRGVVQPEDIEAEKLNPEEINPKEEEKEEAVYTEENNEEKVYPKENKEEAFLDEWR